MTTSPAPAAGYRVCRLADAPSVPCPCGVSTRPLTGADTGGAFSLHVTAMTDSARHYHRRSAEAYYVLEGTGRMELGGDVVDVEPGTVVHIAPLTRHRLVSAGGVRAVVVAVPAFDPADEFFD